MMITPIRTVEVFDIYGGSHTICIIPGATCTGRKCQSSLCFSGWPTKEVPKEVSDHQGTCLKHLLEQGMNSYWGEGWETKVKKFLKENPDLCLEQL